MMIPSGGCDAMHMAAEFEVLRRDLRIAEEHLGLARGERDAMGKRLVESERELAEVKAAFDGAKLGMKALNELLVKTQAERDALLEAVKNSIDACDHCKNAVMFSAYACPEDYVCADCPKMQDCVCGRCKGGSEFDFVGVKEADGNG